MTHTHADGCPCKKHKKKTKVVRSKVVRHAPVVGRPMPLQAQTPSFYFAMPALPTPQAHLSTNQTVKEVDSFGPGKVGVVGFKTQEQSHIELKAPETHHKGEGTPKFVKESAPQSVAVPRVTFDIGFDAKPRKPAESTVDTTADGKSIADIKIHKALISASKKATDAKTGFSLSEVVHHDIKEEAVYGAAGRAKQTPSQVLKRMVAGEYLTGGRTGRTTLATEEARQRARSASPTRNVASIVSNAAALVAKETGSITTATTNPK